MSMLRPRVKPLLFPRLLKCQSNKYTYVAFSALIDNIICYELLFNPYSNAFNHTLWYFQSSAETAVSNVHPLLLSSTLPSAPQPLSPPSELSSPCSASFNDMHDLGMSSAQLPLPMEDLMESLPELSPPPSPPSMAERSSDESDVRHNWRFRDYSRYLRTQALKWHVAGDSLPVLVGGWLRLSTRALEVPPEQTAKYLQDKVDGWRSVGVSMGLLLLWFCSDCETFVTFVRSIPTGGSSVRSISSNKLHSPSKESLMTETPKKVGITSELTPTGSWPSSPAFPLNGVHSPDWFAFCSQFHLPLTI